MLAFRQINFFYIAGPLNIRLLVLHPSCFQHIRASENTYAAEAKSLLITCVPHLLHASFPTCGKGLGLPGPQTGLSHVERMKWHDVFLRVHPSKVGHFIYFPTTYS